MSRAELRRERARERQRRHRERQTERARLAAIAEAEKLDKIVPAAQRLEHFAAPSGPPSGRRSGSLLTGPRVAVIDGRAVRMMPLECGEDPIVAFARKSKQITELHVEAARRLQLDWDEVGTGLNVGAIDYLRVGGGGSGGDGTNMAMMAQVAARLRLEAALTWLGAFAPAMARVVLDNVPINVWAAEEGKAPRDAVAWLVAGLDRLLMFYRPPSRQQGGTPHPLAFGPARAAYQVEAGSSTLTA